MPRVNPSGRARTEQGSLAEPFFVLMSPEALMRISGFDKSAGQPIWTSAQPTPEGARGRMPRVNPSGRAINQGVTTAAPFSLFHRPRTGP